LRFTRQDDTIRSALPPVPSVPPAVIGEDMERGNGEYQTVVLAALLHDVGKLLGRGSFAILDKGQHPRFSADFISAFGDIFADAADVSLLKELVQRHHETPQHFGSEFLVQEIADSHVRTLATLVSKADNLSSSERGTRSEQWQDYRETPLASVLERLNQVDHHTPHIMYHASELGAPASLAAAFPEAFTGYGQDELNRHAQRFGQDFRDFFTDGGRSAGFRPDFDSLVAHLVGILYKFTWCLPSNTQEAVPDVALFDHLRTTAAIASCLYQYHSVTCTLNEGDLQSRDVSPFCLVVGDISGIQNYIFSIASIGVGGGIARRLRARSLFVQLCAEVAAHMILRRLGLPIVLHTVMNSGGRFYLLLPNLPEVIQELAEAQRVADEWFLRELNGELTLNLAWLEFEDSGFQAGEHEESGFGRVLEAVNARLDGRKRNRFVRVLQDSGHWIEGSFVMDTPYGQGGACISCRKFPGNGEGLCVHCQLDRDIGSILPNARYLAFHDDATGSIPVLGYSIDVCETDKATHERGEPYVVLKLNDPDLRQVAAHPAMSRYLATHVAKPDDCEVCREAKASTATFECIARRAKGETLLGFLKADVDRLGETFIYGLKHEPHSADTISRISTLSRMLDLFFSGWVEHLTRSNGDIYTVFSGGDDLFLVGPWDSVLDLATTINEDFARFTGNPSLTISTGVVFAKHDFPIASAARSASEALEHSKRNGRDRITVLGRTITWEEWATVRQEWYLLRPMVGQIPSAFLHNLLRFSAMWQRYRCGDTLGLRYHPLLAYSTARNVDRRRTPELYRWAETLLTLRPGNRTQELILDNLGLIATLLIYSKRGGGA